MQRRVFPGLLVFRVLSNAFFFALVTVVTYAGMKDFILAMASTPGRDALTVFP